MMGPLCPQCGCQMAYGWAVYGWRCASPVCDGFYPGELLALGWRGRLRLRLRYVGRAGRWRAAFRLPWPGAEELLR